MRSSAFTKLIINDHDVLYKNELLKIVLNPFTKNFIN